MLSRVDYYLYMGNVWEPNTKFYDCHIKYYLSIEEVVIVTHVGTDCLGMFGHSSYCFIWWAIHISTIYQYLRNLSSCSVLCFKKHLDLYLRTITDLSSQPGFNNSLDKSDYIEWWSRRDDLADN